MLIFACPGQGSQTPGFLSPWLEAYPQLEATLTSLGEPCGADLVLQKNLSQLSFQESC